MDKPPTKWAAIYEPMKKVLDPLGFKTEEDWLKHGDKRCGLCPNADHLYNRCVTIFAASDEGQRVLGTTKAAERIQLAMQAKGMEINTVADVGPCFECALAGEEDAATLAAAMVDYIADAADLGQSDDANELFHAAANYGTLADSLR